MRKVIKQPNHLYAFYSDVVNDFTAMNITGEIVLDRLTAVVGLEDATKAMRDAENERSASGHVSRPLHRWKHAIEEIAENWGPDVANARKTAGDHAHLPIDVARDNFFAWDGPENVDTGEVKYYGMGGPFTAELFIYAIIDRRKHGYRGIVFFRSGEFEDREEFLSDVPFDVASAANQWAHKKARGEIKRLWAQMVRVDAAQMASAEMREDLMEMITIIDGKEKE